MYLLGPSLAAALLNGLLNSLQENINLLSLATTLLS
jgi:hypothetical protein